MLPATVIGLLLPLTGAAALMLLLRRSLPAGRAAIAGVLAAVLLGPDVMGRLLPGPWERWFIGGQTERLAAEADLRATAIERHVAMSAAVDAAGEARPQDDRRWKSAVEPVRAVRTHAVALFAFLLLLSAFARSSHPPPSFGGTVTLSAWNIGFFSAIIPAGLAAIVLSFTGRDLPVVMACAAALAAGGLPVRNDDREIGDAAEESGASLMRAAGLIATLLAMLLAATALHRAEERLIALWPLLAIPLGAFLPGRLLSQATGFTPWFLAGVLALSGSVQPILGTVHLGALIGLALLTTDGRWLGAVLGAVIPGGRRPLASMRLASLAMAAAPSQSAFAGLLLMTGLLAPAHYWGLVAGVVLAESTAPLRRRAARHLQEAEEELDDLRPL